MRRNLPQNRVALDALIARLVCAVVVVTGLVIIFNCLAYHQAPRSSSPTTSALPSLPSLPPPPKRFEFDAGVHPMHAFRFRAFTTEPAPVYILETTNSLSQLEYQQRKRQEVAIRRQLRRIAPTGLVIDVGANEGTFSLLSAAYGAHVIAVEPQPSCRLALQATLSVNRFEHAVHVVAAVVGVGDRQHRVSRAEPCSGVRAFPASSVGARDMADVEYVPTIALDEMVGNATVEALHIDAEGAEIPVLESAASLLAEKRVLNLFVEINPGRWPMHAVSRERADAVLRRLLVTYTCVDLETDAKVTTPKSFPDAENFETDLWCRL